MLEEELEVEEARALLKSYGFSEERIQRALGCGLILFLLSAVLALFFPLSAVLALFFPLSAVVSLFLLYLFLPHLNCVHRLSTQLLIL